MASTEGQGCSSPAAVRLLKLGRMILHLDNRQALTAAYRVLHNNEKRGRANQRHLHMAFSFCIGGICVQRNELEVVGLRV